MLPSTSLTVLARRRPRGEIAQAVRRSCWTQCVGVRRKSDKCAIELVFFTANTGAREATVNVRQRFAHQNIGSIE